MNIHLLAIAALLTDAWSAMEAGQPQTAAALYARAADTDPRSEDAWLGQQWAQMTLEHWTDAAAAGERALALNPNNAWAVRRQAWIRYVQRDYRAAAAHYRQAVVLAPDDGEMMLGLGFALARDARADQARPWCSFAGARLGDDPRIATCFALANDEPSVFAGVSTTQLSATGGTFDAVSAVTVTAGAQWAAGSGLWAGVTRSGATLSATGEDWDQQVAVVGGAFVRDTWRFELGAGWLTTDDDALSVGEAGTALFIGSAGPSFGDFGVELAGVVGLWPDAPARSHLRMARRSARDTMGRPFGFRARRRDAALVARRRRLAADRRADLDRLWIHRPQSQRVEADGLSVWSGTDHHLSGLSTGLTWNLGLADLFAEVEHRVGEDSEQSEYSIYGGTLGVRFSF